MEQVNIGFLLRNLTNLTRKKIESLNENDELTGIQKYLIGYLVMEGRKRELFQRDVEKHMQISRASVTSILKSLEKNGYIVRESVENDARLKKIVVTQKGLASFEEGKAVIEKTEKIIRTGISDEELSVFLAVADKIRKNLGCDSLSSELKE